MFKKVWTDELISRAVLLLKDYTYEEAAEILGKTPCSLKNAAEKYDFIKHPGRIKNRRQWKNSDLKRINYLRGDGCSWIETSEHFENASPATTRAFWHRNARSQGYLPRETRDRLPKEFIANLAVYKKQGLSYSEMASKLNTTKNAIAGAVYRHLK